MTRVHDPTHLTLQSCVVDLRTGRLSGGRDGTLTSRQLQLLLALLREEGQVVERGALFEAFGYAPTARSRAVDKAMTGLRAKVEADPTNPVHLVTAFGQGYAFHSMASPDHPPEVTAVAPRISPPDRFVGREASLAELHDALDASNLVTLVGPGGVGKTRLASEVLDAGSRSGVWIDLATARDARDLQVAVALGLGRDATALSDDTIGACLAARPGQLVVLDNLEHLVEHAPVIATWSHRAPRTNLLLTSRRPLRLHGERVIRVDPLEPRSSAELLRARTLELGHPIREDEPVADLVQRLDGLPLALELAA
ncbi:MAG: winged helix-turn-helix domain-containing protein, partial [Myxococcota bacterium]